MSLYYVQKFLYELNRDPKLQEAYLADRRAVLEPYDLDEKEVEALIEPGHRPALCPRGERADPDALCRPAPDRMGRLPTADA